MNSLLIIGAGGHGKVVADIAKQLGLYKEIAFLDDSCMTESLGLKVIGKTADAQKYIDKADIFVAIGDAKIRKDFVESLSKKGAKIPTFIHPSAIIGSYVKIGKGSVVMAENLIKKLQVAYIKNIKKYMVCPSCGDKLRINKKGNLWKCDKCDYKLSHKKLKTATYFGFAMNVMLI